MYNTVCNIHTCVIGGIIDIDDVLYTRLTFDSPKH